MLLSAEAEGDPNVMGASLKISLGTNRFRLVRITVSVSSLFTIAWLKLGLHGRAIFFSRWL